MFAGCTTPSIAMEVGKGRMEFVESLTTLLSSFLLGLLLEWVLLRGLFKLIGKQPQETLSAREIVK